MVAVGYRDADQEELNSFIVDTGRAFVMKLDRDLGVIWERAIRGAMLQAFGVQPRTDPPGAEVEAVQPRQHLFVAGGDVVEFVLHARRERVVDQVGEVPLQQVYCRVVASDRRYDDAQTLRCQPLLSD